MPIPSPPTAPVGFTLTDQLVPIAGTDRHLDPGTGREYRLWTGSDGTPIPMPCQVTDDERAEIDRRSLAYQQQLADLFAEDHDAAADEAETHGADAERTPAAPSQLRLVPAADHSTAAPDLESIVFETDQPRKGPRP